ncbi:cold shock domain-containing protein [Candidatus Kaiserbacteria bacterium]|nr:cold shock domain-containing protein [Candidatus Kaiserbacteria bacterium]
MNGTIAIKKDSGFGFIAPSDGGKDVFFHASALVDVAFDDIQQGDAVTFDITEGPKGPAAENVQRTSGAAAAPEAGEEAAE